MQNQQLHYHQINSLERIHSNKIWVHAVRCQCCVHHAIQCTSTVAIIMIRRDKYCFYFYNKRHTFELNEDSGDHKPMTDLCSIFCIYQPDIVNATYKINHSQRRTWSFIDGTHPLILLLSGISWIHCFITSTTITDELMIWRTTRCHSIYFLWRIWSILA